MFIIIVITFAIKLLLFVKLYINLYFENRNIKIIIINTLFSINIILLNIFLNKIHG